MQDFLGDSMRSKLYSDFYKSSFGQEILKREVRFIKDELNGCKKVLSIGCGSAIHEVQLANLNPETEIIGLDISKDMLSQVPKLPTNIDLILGNAEDLGFKDNIFDLVYFLTSLEFTNDVEKTLLETKRILKPNGRAIFMVVNINSWYVQKELREGNSYIKRKLKNMEGENLKKIISKHFKITYFKLMLGIHKEEIFESEDPKWASLFVIKSIK